MKTIWIIDGAYLLKAATGRFDYFRLKALLTSLNGSELSEGYYLNSTTNPPSDQQDSFHTWLKLAPPKGPKLRVQLYKLKHLNVRCSECQEEFAKEVQKGVDVGIATLILKLAFQKKHDRLILSAGDGDFEDAIDYAKAN